MRMPCEITVNYILPNVRASLARSLAEMGYKQEEIASIIGVAQPVISGYLKSGLHLPKDLKILTNVIEAISSELKSTILSQSTDIQPIDLIPQICNYCYKARVLGPICAAHRSTNLLPSDCSLCLQTDSKHSTFTDRAEVKQRLLQAARRLYFQFPINVFIPEIGSQFAFLCVTSEVPSILDVLGFPGRIIKYKDTVKIIDEPEFGVSKIASNILLQFYKKDPEKRCVVILKNSAIIQEKLGSSKHLRQVYTQNADENWNKLFETLNPREFDALCDSGAAGYEALVYFFSSTPEDMVTMISQLLTL